MPCMSMRTAALVAQLLALPEITPFRQIELVEEAYIPSWPPMSPISSSYFECCSTYDFPVRSRPETIFLWGLPDVPATAP
jgi:hypothetical protein